MAPEEKPRLDLAKLLGKKTEAAATTLEPTTLEPTAPEPAAAEPAPATLPAEKSTGLNLGKLMARAQLETETPPVAATQNEPTARNAPAGEVQLNGKISFSTPPVKPTPKPAAKPLAPAKLLGVGGQRAAGQVGHAGGVAKGAGASAIAGAFSQPVSAPDKDQALHSPAPSNRKLEQQMSVKGAKQDRLNVVQKEARKYPLGHFGIDEIFFCLSEVVNVARVNVWRALDEYPKFILQLESIGAERRTMFVEWDGENFSPILEQASGEPTLVGALDADDIIDHMRGKISCTQMEIGPYPQLRGDVHLARVLHIMHMHANLTDEQREFYEEREAEKNAARAKARARCKTPLEWLEQYITLSVETCAKFIDEPIFFRVTVDSEPKQEILFHIEAKKLTTLAGKPGETLLPGAVEVAVSPLALQALWDMECNWQFLFTAGQMRATGELDLLSRLRWLNPEVVRRIRIFNRLQKPLAPDSAEYWHDVRKVKPAGLRPG